MKPQLTKEEFIPTLRMERQACRNLSAVIVEADPDSRFYRQFFQKSSHRIFYFKGKKDVKEIIRNHQNLGGILGIIDADCCYYLKEVNDENIFLTDFRDLECMLVVSPALEKILNEYCDDNKLEGFIHERGIEYRDILLEAVKYFGILMCYSEKYNLGLKFKDLECQDFIDTKTIKFDLELFISILKEKTNPELFFTDPFKNLISIIEGELEKERNLWLICRGHDITKLILFTLHRFVGKEFVRKYSPDDESDLKDVYQLERELRLAYDNNLFKQSRLYQSIQEWEQNNPPFKIL